VLRTAVSPSAVSNANQAGNRTRNRVKGHCAIWEHSAWTGTDGAGRITGRSRQLLASRATEGRRVSCEGEPHCACSLRKPNQMSQGRERTRRTGTARSGGRAADVVDRVVAATFEELSRVGYAEMRVEDIATLSGVNKTTIYRRWPTKAELLTSAVIEYAKKHGPSIDTGTLREDLHASLIASFKLRPYEQGVLRVVQMERSAEGVDAFARRMRDELRAMRIAMVRKGIARGELPPGVDVELVVDVVSAPVQRALLFNENMDSASIHRVLDLTLAGAAADAVARAKASSRRKRARVAPSSQSARSRAHPKSSRQSVTNRSAAAARRAKKL
jgi:AcrR family transcriptional regulator